MQLVRGVAEKFYFYWFCSFFSAFRAGFFLLYDANWMMSSVLNLWKIGNFMCEFKRQKGFGKVCKNKLHNIVWPKQIFFLQKLEAIMNPELILRVPKFKSLYISLMFHFKVVMKVFFKRNKILRTNINVNYRFIILTWKLCKKILI